MDARKKLTPWLIMLDVPDFGPAHWHQLLSHVEWDTLVSATGPQLRDWGFNPRQIDAIQHPDTRRLERVYKWLEQSNDHFILCWHDQDYPAQLRQIANPPLVLFGRGPREVLSHIQVAMVGSRAPTEYGRRQAVELASGLSRCGVVITSGLALGIDGAAHRGAINVQGKTIAVLGAGIDVVYPKRHQSLASEILAMGGVLLSEFAPGVKPLAHHFPRRNRIISGLSKGVLVVEAAIKSGSLITARFALEQNREIFAMPGSVHSPLSQGCHYLIQQGALLVQSSEEVMAALSTVGAVAIVDNCSEQQKNAAINLATDALLDSVDYEVTSIDDVALRSRLDIHVVTARLLEYELRGLVTTVPGGYIKLRG